MFTKHTARDALVAAALVAAAAGSALAADTPAPARNVFDSEAHLAVPATPGRLTRAQVRAEFIAARAAGELSVFDTETTAYAQHPVRERATRLAQAAKPASASAK